MINTNKKYSLLLGIIWILILLHFLKDLTQDIFEINTILDTLGNITEDLSKFPEWLIWLYHWAMVNTVLCEMYLIYIIPKYFLRKISLLEMKIMWGSIIYVPIMFLLAFLLSL